MKLEPRLSACRCGHDREAHEHYRRGSECALCDCERWNPPRWPWRRFPRSGRENLALYRDLALNTQIAAVITGCPSRPAKAGTVPAPAGKEDLQARAIPPPPCSVRSGQKHRCARD